MLVWAEWGGEGGWTRSETRLTFPLQLDDDYNERTLWAEIFGCVQGKKHQSIESIMSSIAAVLRHHAIDPRDPAALTTMYDHLQQTRKIWEKINPVKWHNISAYESPVVHSNADTCHAAIQLATKIDMI